MWKVLLLLLPMALPSVQAYEDPTRNDLCVIACVDCLYEVTFATTVTTDDYWTGWCTDTLLWESIYVCSTQYCTPRQIKGGRYILQSWCQEVDLSISSYDAIMANYTMEDIMAVRVFEHEEISAEEIVNSSVIPAKDYHDNAIQSEVDWMVVYKAHFDYSWAMYGFWGIVLLTGIINRLFAAAVHWRIRRTPQDSAQLAKPRFSTVRRLIQKHVTLPAVFGYRHQQPLGWCTIPTRIQSFLVFAYVAINLLLCAMTYRANDKNVFWPTVSQQTWTYLADRTGILALANMPLVWIFAGRNDIFLWLTGWNFGTFNVFHRWIARITTTQVIVHAVAYTVIYRWDGFAGYAEAWTEEFWYCGVMATIAFSFLMLFSAFPVRQRAYELFLKLHVGLSVFALVGTFYHIKIFDGEFEPFLWPCVAIWSFDHFLRLVRLLMLNYKLAYGRHSKALIKYNADRDVIRIHFTPSFHKTPRPGTHYFLYFPTMIKSFGNHPFSLSSWTVPGSLSASSPVRSLSVDPEKVSTFPSVRTTEAEVSSESDNSQKANSQIASSATPELRFVIRPYKGLTAHLRDAVIKTGTGATEMSILVEGPYGHPHPLLTFDNVLLIVGGSGIAAVLPYIQEFLQPHNNIRTKHIHLVWAAREYSFVRDVLDDELAAAASAQHRVKMDFYITGPAPKVVKAEALDLDRFDEADTRINYQRPVSENVVLEEAAEAVGSLAVFVCGPGQMADDARRAAVHVVGNGFNRLEYFEEQFGW